MKNLQEKLMIKKIKLEMNEELNVNLQFLVMKLKKML